MAQFDFGTIDPSTKSGTQLANDLNSFRNALNSLHSGATRPAYITAGMLWINDSTNPWTLNLYDGGADIPIMFIDTVTNRVIDTLDTKKLLITTGTVNTYTVTPIHDIVSYTNGLEVYFRPNIANTGACTLAVGSLAGKNLLSQNGNPLGGGELLTTGVYTAVYDGTNFILKEGSYQLKDSALLNANSSQTLNVGYPSAVDIITVAAGPVTIQPDLKKPYLKTLSQNVSGTINIDAPVDLGACVVTVAVDATGGYGFTLGTNVFPIGALPTLAASTNYEIRIVHALTNVTTVEVVKIG